MLAQHYKNRTDSDWSLPPGVGGANSLGQLLNKTTEFEHSIFVDLGKGSLMSLWSEKCLETLIF